MSAAHHILNRTCAEFIEHAASEYSQADATTAYRDFFRRGNRAEWLSVPDMPINQTRRENGTIKFTQDIGDGLETETVVIPGVGSGGRERTTLCLSSQIGCAMGCRFCQTAQMGLMRNLTTEQIVAQWFAARFTLDETIDNLVFMGMGEPMDNIDAVLQAICVFADHNGANIAPARITVSTVGRTDGIRRYAALAQKDGFGKLRLAVSVNAPNDEIRSSIMPLNRAEPMVALMDAMREWPRRILIEYVLIPSVNDAMDDADELCEYLTPLDCTVNVIPYNPRADSPWPAPDEESVARFIERIAANGQFVKRRRTHGRSVMAACGQLGNERIRNRRFVSVTSTS